MKNFIFKKPYKFYLCCDKHNLKNKFKSYMKKLLVTALIFLSVSAYSQNFGVGFRFGDPSGITLKKYLGDKALEISFGRTGIFYGNNWYYNNFDHWYKHKHYNYEDLQYLNFYHLSPPLGLQVHYLYQKGIKGTDSDVGVLDWYIGFGGQLSFQNYSYDYRYKIAGDPDWYYVTKERVTDIGIGADGVIGLEYKFIAPFAIFLDFTLDMEIYDDPFLFWGQGGIGARYNF